jgi:hypothetical protein
MLLKDFVPALLEKKNNKTKENKRKTQVRKRERDIEIFREREVRT